MPMTEEDQKDRIEELASQKLGGKSYSMLREELAFDGPSVIVARRACIEAQKRKVV